MSISVPNAIFPLPSLIKSQFQDDEFHNNKVNYDVNNKDFHVITQSCLAIFTFNNTQEWDRQNKFRVIHVAPLINSRVVSVTGPVL